MLKSLVCNLIRLRLCRKLILWQQQGSSKYSTSWFSLTDLSSSFTRLLSRRFQIRAMADDRRSSSPEVLEVIEKGTNVAEKQVDRDDKGAKKKRKTVAESLRENAKRWEAEHRNNIGQGKKKYSSDQVSSDDHARSRGRGANQSDTSEDEVEIIEVVPQQTTEKVNGGFKGLYSPKSPLCNRHWKNTPLGSEVQSHGLPANSLPFSVMTYNVLSDELLARHPYLYRDNNPKTLDWSFRQRGLMREIRRHLPDILCLQEVEAGHMVSYFKNPLSSMGYEGIYKQRTGDKVDGCAVFWQRGKFKLQEETSVEFYQPGVQILNRDNIAVLVRLAVLGSQDQLVVSTTHLLYNPKRTDVRLAQMQILLAELDRLSHHGSTRLPVILTGDFNLHPFSEVYQLLTQGVLQYNHPTFGPSLLPSHLLITDCCRHSLIAASRQLESDGSVRTQEMVAEELALLQIYHSERKPQNKNLDKKAPENHQFGTGNLRHQLPLISVYEHPPNLPREHQDASSYQDDWVTVDYIFYSGSVGSETGGRSNCRELNLLSRWTLPSVNECRNLGPIPNWDAPSDHLPLVACFLFSDGHKT